MYGQQNIKIYQAVNLWPFIAKIRVLILVTKCKICGG